MHFSGMVFFMGRELIFDIRPFVRPFSFVVFSWLILLSSCASGPNVSVAEEINATKTFSKALPLCLHYKIKGESCEVEKAVYESSILEMKKCFEKVYIRYPESKDRLDFVTFFRSLHRKDLNQLQNSQWNAAVTASVQKLANPEVSPSKEEIEQITYYFPDFAKIAFEKSKPEKYICNKSGCTTASLKESTF